MSNYVTLVGSDGVRSAGHRIASAASEMLRAGGNIDDALERHRRWMDDWLQRFEAAIDKLAPSP